MATEKEFLAKVELLDTKQNKLTTGSGIAISNTNVITGETYTQTYSGQGVKIGEITRANGSTVNVTTPSAEIVELTQSEYDALPSSKNYNNITYFIKDVDDIIIWMGTYDEYDALPLAQKKKDNYLYFIIPNPESPVTP